MPYTNAPGTSATDRLRLLVGDVSTSTSGTWLNDADYTWFDGEGSYYIAASLAATALSALFSGAAASAVGDGFIEKSVGDLKIRKADATAAAREFRSLAATYGRMAGATVKPYAGGTRASDVESVGADVDRMRPAFTARLFDNKGTSDLTRASTGP